jgi:predicted site-specific integrase-resolvase
MNSPSIDVQAAYDVAGAARVLDVATVTVRLWLNNGRLDRAYLAGGKTVLVTAASVERELARRKGGAA